MIAGRGGAPTGTKALRATETMLGAEYAQSTY